MSRTFFPDFFFFFREMSEVLAQSEVRMFYVYERFVEIFVDLWIRKLNGKLVGMTINMKKTISIH